MSTKMSNPRIFHLVLTIVMAGAAPSWSVAARADDAPIAAPGYALSTFAEAPAGLSKPDSLAMIGGNIWIGYGNGGKPDGSDGGSSQIVEYSLDGKVLKTLTVKGHNDGLRQDPITKKVWALQNEDGDANLVVIDPQTEAMDTYGFDPGKHGGGYDDMVFKGGQVFITASAPSTDDGKTNPGPCLVSARLGSDHKVKVESLFPAPRR